MTPRTSQAISGVPMARTGFVSLPANEVAAIVIDRSGLIQLV
jgi:hypothetical protein